MKKMYIAGKVTGEPQRATLTKFIKAKEVARDLGYTMVSPMDFVPAYMRKTKSEASWRKAMKLCVRELFDCSAALFCYDFSKSRGAIIEHYIAIKLGIPRYYLNAKSEIVQYIDEHGKLRKPK